METVSTVGVSWAVAINHRSRSFQFSIPHLSSTIAVPLPTAFSSPSSLPRVSCAELHLHNGSHHSRSFHSSRRGLNSTNLWISDSIKLDPLKIMILGAPASGKGTQCELIKKKYDLVHIAAGDLLRAEIAADTENGKLAKEYMEKGMLVPDEIVVTMVKERLLQPDSQEKGWLLDGYPRSLSQAKALEDLGIRPDLIILLEINEDVLVQRVVGRRLDPFTGKIYHLKYSLPENEDIARRLVQRFDDTEEKVKLRLKTHHQNVAFILSLYSDITVKVNADLPKEEVFHEIDRHLLSLLEAKSNANSTSLQAGMAH